MVTAIIACKCKKMIIIHSAETIITACYLISDKLAGLFGTLKLI